MGFAASQARFLSLTARLSDNEYEAQQISQERVALTNQMAIYADEFAAATTNQFMAARIYDFSTNSEATVALDYNIIQKDQMDGGLGLRLVTSSGLRVVPSEEEMNNQIKDAAKNGEYLTAADFYVFEDVKNTSVLQKNLEEGNFYLASRNEEGEWDKKNYASLDSLTMKYDQSDDAAAKATYDKRMKLAEAKDAMLEMRLHQLESEHKAIQTEMDSVQKVVDDNVEGSFKTFG